MGIGRGLYESLFAVLTLQGFCSAYAGISLPNPASVGLHESMGFESVGIYQDVGYKHGAWHDVGWWQLSLREHTAEPDLPRPIEKLRGSAMLTDALAAGIEFIDERDDT